MIKAMISNVIRPVIANMIGDEIGGGGGGLQPSGSILLIEAYDSANFSLVTGDSISQADDLSEQANHLTQPTSGNQLKLVESNTLTQFAGAKQSTYQASTQALRFDGNDEYRFNVDTTGDFDITIDETTLSVGNHQILTSTGTLAYLNILGDKTVRFFSDTGTVFDFDTLLTSANKVFRAVKTGDNLEIFRDAVSAGTQDVTGETFTLDTIENSGSVSLVDYHSITISNPSKSLTIDNSDPSKMRTSANIPPIDGDSVAKVYAEEHSGYRDNEILGDDDDDFMLGILPQAGDFTYTFKKEAKTLGTVKKLFSSSTTSAEVRINVSNQIEVVSDAGTVFTYATSSVLAEQQVNLLRLEGIDLALYETQTALETKDVTGETFTLDYWCAGTNSSDSGWKYIGLYPRALDQSGIDYFYYLRNADTGEILLPPLLPS